MAILMIISRWISVVQYQIKTCLSRHHHICGSDNQAPAALSMSCNIGFTIEVAS
jgi:hypothetical protein